METPAATPVPPPEASKARRRFRGRMLWMFGLLAAVAGGTLLILFWQDRRSVGTIQAQLDRGEPGWRLADLWAEYERTIPPDGKNSFLVVDAANKAIPKPFNLWKSQPDSLPLVVMDHERPLGQAVPPRAIADCRQQLAKARAALDLAHGLRAFRDPGGAPTKLAADGFGTLLPHLEVVRNVCDLLRIEGVYAAVMKDPDRALTAAICSVQAGRSIGDEPCHISQLIRGNGATTAVQVAEQTLARNVAGEELLTDLQERLTAEVATSRFLRSARMERACLDQLYENFRTGKDTVRAFAARYGLQVAGSVEVQSVLFAMQENGDHRTVLDCGNELVAVARAPEEQRLGLARQMPPLPERNSVVFKLLTGLGVKETAHATVERDLLLVAPVRCAVAALACERHRLRTGSWPKTLEEIPKDVLPTVPVDPFTGRPVNYKLADGGAVVYSVGPDGADDGGKLWYSAKPPAGTDVGFRLVDSKQRTRE